MTTRPLAWGVLAWPLTGALVCVLPPGDWDMPLASAVGIVAATAFAFALLGAVVTGALSLATGTSISPSSVGVIAELAIAASAASTLGWLVLRVAERQRSHRATRPEAGVPDVR